MAPRSTEGKKSDWFESLDAELEKKTVEVLQDAGELSAQRAELNKTFIDDLWKVWKRFNKINVHFTLEPNYTAWAVFEDTFPDGEWKWRPGFNASGVTSIQLVDRTQDQGRIGDALKIIYYMLDDKTRLKITFEYCDGEHYYKYCGWRRIWSVHTLYDQLLEKADMGEIHKIFADLVKVWYESHLRRNRDLLLKHVKKTYERVETFNQ